MEVRMKIRDSSLKISGGWRSMDTPLRDYHLRPLSRGDSRPPRGDDYLDTSEYNDSRESFAPSRGRSSTPSAAVRRAMQVLDETYRQQSILKSSRWSLSADPGSAYSRPIKTRRSSSPIRSRSPSPIRCLNNNSPNFAPSRLVEIERDNYLDALDDSESRREILLKKLVDAQKTMEVQNERVRTGEMDMNEGRATIRLLQQVQQELETKVEFLQKEKDAYMSRSRQDAEDRETQRRKIEDVTREANRLRCQLDLMLADKEQHHVTLEHLQKSIKDLNDQLKTTTELRIASDNELDATKERLNIARQRCELLEKEKNHAFSELEKNQKTHQALINRNTDIGQRLSRCQTDLQEVSEKYDKAHNQLGNNKEELAMCREKVRKQSKDLSELRKSYQEMQGDRERAITYNVELEKTVHSIKEINKGLKKAKIAYEDDLTQLHADLAKTRLELTKVSDQNTSHLAHWKECQKNCKELTSELVQLRPHVVELSDKVKELEGIHKLDVQQMSLLEAQKAQVNREREDLATKLSALQESYNHLEKHHDDEMKKMNQQVIKTRHEREKANSLYRDMEAQLNRIKEELEVNTQHTKAQIDHWRQACSKLTSLVEEKDEDMRESATRRREAEESLALVETQKRNMEMELDEAQVSQEELTHLRTENKKLSQERAENQQMISVLEMQRDILSKSPSKQASQDSVTKAQTEKLQAELSLTKAKLTQTEMERDECLKKKFNSSFTTERRETDDSDLSRMKGMNQILVEEMAKLRQEAETIQSVMDDKQRNHERDVYKIEREKQQLDLRIASMSDEINALRSNQARHTREDSSELKRLRSEVLRLKQEMEEKDQQAMVMKGECIILENGKKRAEDRISVLQVSMMGRSGDTDRHDKEMVGKLNSEMRLSAAKLDAAKAENATLRLRAKEMEDTKSSQQDVIEILKKHLENNSNSVVDSDSASSWSNNAARDMKALKRDLQRSLENIASRDKQISELKRKFLESQKLEHKARQERDELQGKTIIMESLNASSEDLLKELDEVREEKSKLEKQLSNFFTSKTSQTPPSSLALAEDLDKELEKQYHTVCERNKWLESRIASLQREVELVRDQNSLLQEQRNHAEREASKLREDMKELQMTSKGSRRKSEVEQIHLQQSNAEKIQTILNLERELAEKKQLIQAMAKEMQGLQKKTDKGKISNFMKKLRRSSDSGPSKDPERQSHLYKTNTEGENTYSRSGTFESPSSTGDLGYSTMSTTQPRRASSLSPKIKSSAFGGYNKGRRNSAKSQGIESSQAPPSPALTYVTAMDDVSLGYTPSIGRKSPGERPGKDALQRPLVAARVSFDDNSEQDSDANTPRESSREISPRHDDEEEDDGAFFADDYIPGSSNIPSPDGNEPHPAELTGLPSPTSSPSLPSPSCARKRSVPVYVVAASDDSDRDTGRFDLSGSSDDRPELPSPPVIGKIPNNALSVPGSSKISHEQQHSPPPRPQSQPTFMEMSLSPAISSSRKKHSSLV
ncbi:uncharacterized protein LOC143461781 isoform X2 [Clavelina lepadiformis]|uniref:uncharacterized protein LOC143461781 isoform X2 n=1 Tax=Clavelina lepadiformis TaxID=159417 RepID=UPI0040411422